MSSDPPEACPMENKLPEGLLPETLGDAGPRMQEEGAKAVDATIKSLEKAREKAGMTHALAPDNAAPTPASDSAGLNSSQDASQQ